MFNRFVEACAFAFAALTLGMALVYWFTEGAVREAELPVPRRIERATPYSGAVMMEMPVPRHIERVAR